MEKEKLEKDRAEQERIRQELLNKQKLDQDAQEKQRLKDLEEQNALAALVRYFPHRADLILSTELLFAFLQIAKRRAEDANAADSKSIQKQVYLAIGIAVYLLLRICKSLLVSYISKDFF